MAVGVKALKGKKNCFFFKLSFSTAKVLTAIKLRGDGVMALPMKKYYFFAASLKKDSGQ